MSKKTVICRIDLGMTRIAGYTLYDSDSKEFQETTPGEVKKLVSRGEVNGLKLVDGQIGLDTEGFNTRNLMVKSGVGKYRPLYPTSSIVNCMYAVVRVINVNDEFDIYEIISNKCGRRDIYYSELKILMKMGNVSGVRLDANGDIEVCQGVKIEDNTGIIDSIGWSTDAEIEDLLNDPAIEIESVSAEDCSNGLQDIQKKNADKTQEEKDKQIDDKKKPLGEKSNNIDETLDNSIVSAEPISTEKDSKRTAKKSKNASKDEKDSPSPKRTEKNNKESTPKTKKK